VPLDFRIIERDVHQVNGLSAPWSNGRCIRRCVTCLALIVMLAACGADGSEELYRQATDHVREGELLQAVELLERLVDDYPDSPRVGRALEDLELYRDLARVEQNFPVQQAEATLVKTARALERYRQQRGGWPQGLDDLIPQYLTETPLDPWGRPLSYRRKLRGSGFLLACLGADGEPGGSGPAVDLYVEDGMMVSAPSVSWP